MNNTFAAGQHIALATKDGRKVGDDDGMGRLPPGGDGPYDDRMEARLTAVEQSIVRIDAKLEHMATKDDIQKATNATERWMIATVLTVIGTVVLGFTALFFNLSTGLRPTTAPAQAPIIINVPAAAAPAPAASK